MKSLLINIILVLTALTFNVLLTGVFLIYNVVLMFVGFKFLTGLKNLSTYFYTIAVSLDQYSNVTLYPVLNKFLIKGDNVILFGNEDDTISYVIGRNKYKNSLTKFGKFWAWFLDAVDKNHLDKTIASKIKSDKLAKERLNLNNYKR